MLRTNQSFLSHLETLYQKQSGENIVLESFFIGQKLLIQDHSVSKVMLIKEGITKCYFEEENGKEYIVEFLGSGEIMGEVELIKNIPCLCGIEALTEVVVYTISLSYFNELIQKDLILNNLLLNSFAERIINTSSRASYQQLYTVEHTLTQLLKMQSKQNIQISKEDMAAYLGITVRSLNRILKDLK
ncbi:MULTISPECIES: Crp/Fnr family transcriptional regulator [Chryseobacterium]|uniref:Crp/Fnr family transcriptional regulator n=1 Tax=Chryseobacterium pennae TaxID=2258962 RepID=A0A3D9CDZ3_9FLAO|nr:MULTISPECIES: Crp/Fnr family transcriptional regulator [Chryseobacterium]MCS4302853.1 CRP-like cAMP-binding protein [Chryseobacterium sp. BIGb0232]REC63836.1 Crp/Fnr family transcriptional regulator [Chryseobacterium pennae]ROS17505.1 CRP-like cAMP-binding protein [Chryseobacterium nakagawai]